LQNIDGQPQEGENRHKFRIRIEEVLKEEL